MSVQQLANVWALLRSDSRNSHLLTSAEICSSLSGLTTMVSSLSSVYFKNSSPCLMIPVSTCALFLLFFYFTHSQTKAKRQHKFAKVKKRLNPKDPRMSVNRVHRVDQHSHISPLVAVDLPFHELFSCPV